MTYAKASRARTLGEAMAEDARVFCWARTWATAARTARRRGCRDRFGADRVRDTPISEIAIVGFAVGAAVAGWRPVPEIMHFDFITVAMDQVVNQAAKMRYMFGGTATLPLVIRCGTGGWLNAAAQHSQSLEAWFTHVPGLKVAGGGHADRRAQFAARGDPRRQPRDRAGVAKPVRGFRRGTRRAGGMDSRKRDQTKRTGSDVTIVTWGAMTPGCLEARRLLAARGEGR